MTAGQAPAQPLVAIGSRSILGTGPKGQERDIRGYSSEEILLQSEKAGTIQVGVTTRITVA